MNKINVILIIFMFFLCSKFAFAQDKMVIIFNDGKSQKVTLSKPAYTIKSINFNTEISTKKGNSLIGIIAGTYGRNCGAHTGIQPSILLRIAMARNIVSTSLTPKSSAIQF